MADATRERQRIDARIATGAREREHRPQPAPGDERREEPRTETVLAVLASASRGSGEWEPAELTHVFTALGDATLDFRKALLLPGVTEVQAFAFMGSAKIIVPEGLEVEVNGNALLGDFKQSTAVSKARRLLRRTLQAARGEYQDEDDYEDDLDDDPPLLRVSGFALLGSVKIITR